MLLSRRQFSYPMYRPLIWSSAGHIILLILCIVMGWVPAPNRFRRQIIQPPLHLNMQDISIQPQLKKPLAEPIKPIEPEPEPEFTKPIARNVIYQPKPTPRSQVKKAQSKKKKKPTPKPTTRPKLKPTPKPTSKIIAQKKEPTLKKKKRSPIRKPQKTTRTNDRNPPPLPPQNTGVAFEKGVDLPGAYFSDTERRFRENFQPQARWSRMVSTNVISIVEITIRRDGTIISARLHQSSGHATFDNYALQTARRTGTLLPLAEFTKRQSIKAYVPFSFGPQ